MSELTREQWNAVSNLRAEHGVESTFKIEARYPEDWQHGHIWMQWQGTAFPQGQLEIFIRPDGTMVKWLELMKGHPTP